MSTPATNPPATTPTTKDTTTNAPPTTAPTTATTPLTTTAPTTPATSTTPTTDRTTPPTTQSSAATTSVVTAPTTIPTSTAIITSVVTASNTQQTTAIPTSIAPSTSSQSTSSRASSSSSGANSSSTQHALSSSSGGLSTGGTVAIAVVIPLVVVAALIALGIFLWRRRNRKMSDEEDRRKEMEAYGYNPNDDPSLRPIGTLKDEGMMQDDGGYRGWGSAAISTSGRKTSTNASSGAGDYSGGWNGPSSPTHNGYAQELPANNSTHHRNGTMDSDTMGALGAGTAAAGIARQPSNASSTYSAGERERMSQDYHAQYGHEPNHQPDNTYYNPGPYENSYHNMGDQPVMRDSPARRLTQINEGSAQPQQGGISQNF